MVVMQSGKVVGVVEEEPLVEVSWQGRLFEVKGRGCVLLAGHPIRVWIRKNCWGCRRNVWLKSGFRPRQSVLCGLGGERVWQGIQTGETCSSWRGLQAGGVG